ncbi:Uncharacterised protein [Mycobacteroides abscessus]|nr:Uncharacterised protein [Mycobacteroides abscessus]
MVRRRDSLASRMVRSGASTALGAVRTEKTAW